MAVSGEGRIIKHHMTTSANRAARVGARLGEGRDDLRQLRRARLLTELQPRSPQRSPQRRQVIEYRIANLCISTRIIHLVRHTLASSQPITVAHSRVSC